MSEYWKAGDHCVIRGIVNRQVWMAKSVIVVKDRPEETVLLLIPGAECAFPEGYWRWKKDRDTSQGTRWQEARLDHIPLREFTWQRNRILIFLEPGKYYSYSMFWDHDSGEFGCYYVNYELPYRRSHCGFDSLDLDLDLVIDREYHWRWKDEDDYRAGIREGGIREEWAQEIDRSHEEVFDTINSRRYPLDGSWMYWKPVSTWLPPKLPENWRSL